MEYLRDRVGVPRDLPLAAARQVRSAEGNNLTPDPLSINVIGKYTVHLTRAGAMLAV